MTNKTLTTPALAIIDQYLHFKIGDAVCSIPYFNNKTAGKRLADRAFIGKGNPKDIQEEVGSLMVKNHISADLFTDRSLKKLLVDNNIGIDCSGFAYYILDAESLALGKGPLKKRLCFVNSTGLLGKLRAKLRPVENCDVATFASDENSEAISLNGNAVKPGCIITMTDDSNERDHILVVHQVDYNDSKPIKL
ncbi:MAG: hypothetical protein NTZ38_01105, partial [Candidatus Taylorbacteria bacterium]|nr:hypothetical protein [Candidatus Taylorbacteria bacterium]